MEQCLLLHGGGGEISCAVGGWQDRCPRDDSTPRSRALLGPSTQEKRCMERWNFRGVLGQKSRRLCVSSGWQRHDHDIWSHVQATAHAAWATQRWQNRQRAHAVQLAPHVRHLRAHEQSLGHSSVGKAHGHERGHDRKALQPHLDEKVRAQDRRRRQDNAHKRKALVSAALLLTSLKNALWGSEGGFLWGWRWRSRQASSYETLGE